MRIYKRPCHAGIIAILSLMIMLCSAGLYGQGWETVIDSGNGSENPPQEKYGSFNFERENNLPGNPKDVDKRNVVHATSLEIYNEMRELHRKLNEIKRIEVSENSSLIRDSDREQAIYDNRRRIEKRLKQLQEEKNNRIMDGRWDGFVPSDTPSYEPEDDPPPADKVWGGPLPKVSRINPTTMGRSEIEKEMEQLNKAHIELRKKVDYLNSLGETGKSKLAYKAQAEARLKEVINRLKALQKEKQNQIKKGVWGYSSNDIKRLDATPEQIKAAYDEGYELGKNLKNLLMSSDEVRLATRAAYERFQNNEKLKDAFKRGYSDAVQ